ncbi:MAG: PAS domain S-box protein [Chloroflexi bacterium]|nr:PAS domain S-box protein [Chloroflexota bacterium]
MSDAKILIVEDEGIEALDIQHRLVSLGYPTPEIVFSGEDAVKKAGETSPDVALMDIMLRGEIDGVAAAERIHTLFDIPIIYVTAYADEDTLKRAKITEPYGYIIKPFKDREVHIAIDVALYKHKMERTLKESEKWLATTLRSIGDGVIATDKNGLITFMNAVAEVVTGWKLTEVLNKKLTAVFKIINADTRQLVENPVTRVILEGAVVGLANHKKLIARDGTEVPIDANAAPIKDDKGSIIGAILVFHDVTERERIEAELRTARDELEKRVAERTADLALANKYLKQEIEQRKKAEYKLEEKNIELENAKWAKDRFLATISNELRTALNAIIGFSGTLLTKRTGNLSDDQEKQLQAIRSSAEHLLSLINYLLDLAKIEYGKVEIRTEPVDVAGVIREVVEAMQPVAQQKGLKFTDNIPKSQVVIRTHARALNQILLNLTNNAIKFTEKGEVRLEFAQQYRGGGFQTEISVVDTGVGIREEDQKRIFEPFPQLKAAPSSLREGAGLGLHLSQKLAELIGGEISCRSAYGRGSTFTLTLK